ncbi:hypothetical protein [Treponema socranskii]|uniref:hypothetical protein n=1 Tax=Treponema socranskii TaxID=53419 RepID=UPI003D6EC8E7
MEFLKNKWVKMLMFFLAVVFCALSIVLGNESLAHINSGVDIAVKVLQSIFGSVAGISAVIGVKK